MLPSRAINEPARFQPLLGTFGGRVGIVGVA